MRLPNILIIGAPKCGTSALYAALARHPQIYMSQVKEPFFFAFEGQPPVFVGPDAEAFRRDAITSWADYQALFAAAGDQLALGEASTLYLTNYQPERTAENIRRRLPDVRLVAVLRQPADRAYSHFTYRRQRGHEPLRDFRQALAAEEWRIAANWSPACRYLRDGLYFCNLTPYFDRFSRERIQIYLYDDWNDRPQVVLADLCRFLQVDATLLPAQITRRNVTSWTRSRFLAILLRQTRTMRAALPKWLHRGVGTRLGAWNKIKPPPLDPGLRQELTASYRDEIEQLQDLIGRDLSHWLREPA